MFSVGKCLLDLHWLWECLFLYSIYLKYIRFRDNNRLKWLKIQQEGIFFSNQENRENTKKTNKTISNVSVPVNVYYNDINNVKALNVIVASYDLVKTFQVTDCNKYVVKDD